MDLDKTLRVSTSVAMSRVANFGSITKVAQGMGLWIGIKEKYICARNMTILPKFLRLI